MSEDAGTASAAPGLKAERTKAFVDAVVAIAMTLLILPLMDSVNDSAARNHTTAEWLIAERDQLQSFLISFVLIAMFWMLHHRLFVSVMRVSAALFWITVGWMLTIVWMPVVTALTGQVDDDPLQKAIYIGSLIATTGILLATRIHLLRRPELHSSARADLRVGMSIDVSMIVLFALALVIAIAVPAIGYLALFVMFLTGVVQRGVSRLLR
ncbi:TMEM175 family protein [Microbacterium sp. NM3R9]|uniref:TMEM175 family protein n=1 Tax=Microbacterium thalli TaxID=3027921 RepID=UPI002365C1C8|nr:TMEM175 family protein [Microbacterium thalli]MDD7928248.1 TMEM175 family protein [Microbacterium thalli]MDN8549944.1 TMEM175 family protein [Microbacterium thalli]